MSRPTASVISLANYQQRPTFQRAANSAVCRPSPEADVGSLEDEELLTQIAMCWLQMLAAEKLGMRDERRRWYDEQCIALREKNRRPELVARLEAERGLS